MSSPVLSLLAALIAVAAPAAAPDEPAAVTKDRLSPAQSEQLVAAPMAFVRRGDLAGGKAAVEAMVTTAGDGRDGRIAAADTLESFGVQLYVAASGDRRLLEAAVQYLGRAVAAYQAAFGADDPEVAVALNSYADLLIALSPNRPPSAAIDALERAYRIRSAALGEGNPETVATRVRVSTLKAGIAPPTAAAATAILTQLATDLDDATAARDPRVLIDLLDNYAGLVERIVRAGDHQQAARLEEVIERRVRPLALRNPDTCRALVQNDLRWRRVQHGSGPDDDTMNRADLGALVSGDCGAIGY